MRVMRGSGAWGLFAALAFLAGCQLFGPTDDSGKAGSAYKTHQAAKVVIGQADFTSDSTGVSASSLSSPWGNPVLVGGVLYVPDSGNKRVLAYHPLPSSNGASAQFALGADVSSAGSGTLGQGSFTSIFGVASDGTRLAVVEASSARVSLYSTVPTLDSLPEPPSVLVGGTDWNTASPGQTAATLAMPNSSWLVDGKLLVADTGNNRVLIWDTVPILDGTAANHVLGQPDLTTVDSGTSSTSLWGPNDVWSDGTRVVVVDAGNHRVLIWTSFPTLDGEAADLELGQDGFDMAGPGRSRTRMNNPQYVASNGKMLAVADYYNNRVLVWNRFPTTNNQAPDVVLGQTDFTAGDAPNPPTARSLKEPGGLYFDGKRLVVNDSGNSRLLIYEP